MSQTKHEGKDCYDKAMSPKPPKLRLEAFYDLSTKLRFYITPYCKDSLLSPKANLEFTKNAMFTTIEYMQGNRIFGFT